MRRAIKQANEQAIDDISLDTVLEAAFIRQAKERAEARIASLKQFVKDHKDELVALEILCEQPYGRRKVSF